MHEVVTLQLGQRSNYLATHFWNTQESYFTYSQDEESPIDHDISFRPGLGADGSETFTPRTLIYDLKGGFGSLKKTNALYEIENGDQPAALWDGPSSLQQQPGIEQNAYQKGLDRGVEPPTLTTDTVRFWSDFNRVFYHPKSIVQINEYELNSSLMPFEKWDVGEELFQNLDREHDLLDRDLRPFLEECDLLQGLQIMTGADDAWGGFCRQYLDRLRDESGKTSIWVWGLQDGAKGSRERQLQKTVNTANTLYNVGSQASVYVPLPDRPEVLPPYVSMDARSNWHSAANICAAMETATLPSRLRMTNEARATFDEMAGLLDTNGGQRLAGIQMQLREQTAAAQVPGIAPSDSRAPMSTTKSSVVEVDVQPATAHFTDLDMDMLPGGPQTSRNPHTFSLLEMIRGDTTQAIQNRLGEDQPPGKDYRLADGVPVIRRFRAGLRFPILSSFPKIYEQQMIGPDKEDLVVETGLRANTSIANYVQSIRSVVGRSTNVDEREALSNGLGELAEAYNFGWDSGSDEDDD
ncbi:MAG: hypothetical protein M1825_004683 [Sarcosagium campestre]|nr:MAG: hypothetical protein M1825_004683 [Sarcosagium campestre]